MPRNRAVPCACASRVARTEPPARALLSLQRSSSTVNSHAGMGSMVRQSTQSTRNLSTTIVVWAFSPAFSAWFQPPPQSTRGRVGCADERRCGGACCHQVEKFQRSFKMQAILGGSEEIMCDFAMRQAMRHFGKAASEPGVRPARL